MMAGVPPLDDYVRAEECKSCWVAPGEDCNAPIRVSKPEWVDRQHTIRVMAGRKKRDKDLSA